MGKKAIIKKWIVVLIPNIPLGKASQKEWQTTPVASSERENL